MTKEELLVQLEVKSLEIISLHSRIDALRLQGIEEHEEAESANNCYLMMTNFMALVKRMFPDNADVGTLVELTRFAVRGARKFPRNNKIYGHQYREDLND